MLRRILLICFLFSIAVIETNAQQFILSGKLTNKRNEALPFASVRIKELATGTNTDEAGNYLIRLEQGKYDVVISMIGFKPQIITITISADYTLNVLLEEDFSQTLSEVLIYSTKKDISEEIVKNVIRNKEKHLDAAQTYTAQLYIRATAEKDPVSIKKVNDSTARAPDLSTISTMAEVILKTDRAHPDKIKEVRTGVKMRGNSETLFYLTTTDGDFNFYKNLVQLPALSAMPMLSPVSNSGLIAYKYKTTSIRKEKGRTYYTIRVTPGRLGNALVTGEMEIMDSAWVLTSTHFELPKFHMSEYDYFSVDQQYAWVNDKAWMPIRQDFNYTVREGKGKLSGKTIAIYSDYVIDTNFSKKNFGLELSSTKLEAYERDSVFWEIVRKEPLTDAEIKFVHFRDSISTVQSSDRYKDSLDRRLSRITLDKLFFSGIEKHNWRKERVMYLGSFPQLIRPFEFGGVRIGYSLFLRKRYANRKRISLNTDFSVGLRNRDIQGEIEFLKRYDPYKDGHYRVELGRKFEQIFNGDAWINHLKRSNIYVKDRLRLEHGMEIVNGLYLITEFEYNISRSVANYKTSRKIDTLLGATGPDNDPINFPSYSGSYATVSLGFTPRQKYIREPREKINLGSNYPTFQLVWRKGIPSLFKSSVDFDYLQIDAKHKVKLGLLGDFDYRLVTGKFLTSKQLKVIDYKFMKAGDPVHFMDPFVAFQSLDTTFALFNWHYEGHFVHQFYGAILNKIPLFKKIELREIIGGGVLYAPEKHLTYIELYVGIEKMFRLGRERYKLGGFVVSSIANKFNQPVQLRFSFQRYDKKRNKWSW